MGGEVVHACARDPQPGLCLRTCCGNACSRCPPTQRPKSKPTSGTRKRDAMLPQTRTQKGKRARQRSIAVASYPNKNKCFGWCLAWIQTQYIFCLGRDSTAENIEDAVFDHCCHVLCHIPCLLICQYVSVQFRARGLGCRLEGGETTVTLVL